MELELALKSIHMGNGEIRTFLSAFSGDKDGFIDRKEFETKLTRLAVLTHFPPIALSLFG